jgi:NAD(P)-dependent dehydrogenase (short-subunit alcohol dehydrogenase family)
MTASLVAGALFEITIIIMKDFKGKVAVVTGGASGIGRAIAEALARDGARLVLADIEEPVLAETTAFLRCLGAHVLAVRTDVSKAPDVEALAQRTLAAFGRVDLLFNNAGVSGGGSLWDSTPEDWNWVLGVNVWGVIHGIRTFVPIMLNQGTEAHIINTASVAGLISPPGMGPYNVSKHAVVTLSETLYHELALVDSKIRISVLCPAWVKTGIADSDRNRPKELRNPERPMTELEKAQERNIRGALDASHVKPKDVAAIVLSAIREEKFYILTHPNIKGAIRARMEDILEERAPRNPMELR